MGCDPKTPEVLSSGKLSSDISVAIKTLCDADLEKYAFCSLTTTLRT